MRNIILLATLAVSSRAFAAPCNVPGKTNAPLWVVPLTPNEIYPSHPPGDPSTWDFSKQTYYYQQLHQESPDVACDLWAKKVSPSSMVFTAQMRALNHAFPNAGGGYTCAFDCNGDGKINDDDKNSSCAIFPERNLVVVGATDKICDRMAYVRGPHDDNTTGYIRGAEFDDNTQKNVFKADNTDPQGRGIISDAWNVPMYHPPEPPLQTGYWTFHTDYYDFLKALAGSDDSVQVDHLVPRVDVYGCGCGTNSPRNAALVSAELNHGMSNDPNDPARIALLCEYAPWPGCPGGPYPRIVPDAASKQPGDALASTTHDLDDSGATTQPDEIGGCTTGGGTGGGVTLAFLALGALVQRRKRS